MPSSPSGSAEPAGGRDARPALLVSIDVEDWRDARLSGEAGGDEPAPWLEGPLARLLDLLEAAGGRATFFVLGRLARHHPALVRRLAARHEVATHGETHVDLRRLDRSLLLKQIRDSRRRLEDLSGRAVRGYRAPNWSLGAVLDWGVETVAAAGMAYDSSLIPGGGFWFLPGAKGSRRPYRLPGTAVWEIPPTVAGSDRLSAPIAGGAFLRALPGAIAPRVLERALRRGEWPHLHLHAWELEAPADRPPGLRQRFLFAGAQHVHGKLARVLLEFRPEAIDTALAALAARAAA